MTGTAVFLASMLIIVSGALRFIEPPDEGYTLLFKVMPIWFIGLFIQTIAVFYRQLLNTLIPFKIVNWVNFVRLIFFWGSLIYFVLLLDISDIALICMLALIFTHLLMRLRLMSSIGVHRWSCVVIKM